MAKWTTANIPDQTGRTAVVTGANTGLGYETAAALAAKGAHVVLAVRNLDKGEAAADKGLHVRHPDILPHGARFWAARSNSPRRSLNCFSASLTAMSGPASVSTRPRFVALHPPPRAGR